MDPNETYRLLCDAMERLRQAHERAGKTLRSAGDVLEHWEHLDGWMRKSGFPPVAWNNPAAPKVPQVPAFRAGGHDQGVPGVGVREDPRRRSWRGYPLGDDEDVPQVP
jgi:hypothetical protein